MAEQKTPSISHSPDALPDFRNLGVITRILLAVNAAAFAAALARGPNLGAAAAQFIDIASWVEPALFASLAALYVASGGLARLPYAVGYAAAVALAAAVSAALAIAQWHYARGAGQEALVHSLVFAPALAALLLEYFRLRRRAFSPALAEARLQALQARIRPHFLYNSLNGVLAIMRRDPKRAEGALEDLAELFRSLMADKRQLIPMREEIVLCRQYLNLEHLRLGPRLRVEWSIDPAAEDALVPPMLLQPLVENAVYHGIEPGIAAGTIEIRVALAKDRVQVTLSNPYYAEHQHRQGNRMALANIRERLQLHFDVEASLDAGVEGERYRIDMIMPYRKAP